MLRNLFGPRFRFVSLLRLATFFLLRGRVLVELFRLVLRQPAGLHQRIDEGAFRGRVAWTRLLLDQLRNKPSLIQRLSAFIREPQVATRKEGQHVIGNLGDNRGVARTQTTPATGLRRCLALNRVDLRKRIRRTLLKLLNPALGVVKVFLQLLKSLSQIGLLPVLGRGNRVHRVLLALMDDALRLVQVREERAASLCRPHPIGHIIRSKVIRILQLSHKEVIPILHQNPLAKLFQPPNQGLVCRRPSGNLRGVQIARLEVSQNPRGFLDGLPGHVLRVVKNLLAHRITGNKRRLNCVLASCFRFAPLLLPLRIAIRKANVIALRVETLAKGNAREWIGGFNL